MLGWRYRVGALRVIGLQVVLLVMALSGLGLTGLGIDVILAGISEDAREPRYPFGIAPPQDWTTMGKVGLVAALVFAIAAARFFFDCLSRIWKALLVQSIVVDLRSQVYDKLQRLSFQFFDANESGSIINRVTGDVQAVRRFVDGVLIEVIMIALSLTFFLSYMLSIHVWLTLACLATTPLLWVLTVWFSRTVKPAYMRNRELFDRAVRVLSENIQGAHVVKGFSRQKEEIAKFREANRAVADQKRWIFWRVTTFVPVIGFVPYINIMVLLVFGGWLHIRNPEALPIGTGLFVFAGLLQQFSDQVGNLAQIANAVQQSVAGAQRVFEVLDTPTRIESPPDAVPLKRAEGAVRFDSVTFGYEEGDAPALRDVTLDVKPGQTVAILGATGAGKTTMLSLIPRFYDPDAGRVMIDGRDVREYDLDDLRRNIGLVFQESFLFSTTIAENIAFGHPHASQEQIEKAARIAQAHEFIEQMAHGYESVLREGGSNLSGGQRQRLAIARAILLEPPILLLDDPTAAIDPDTEHEIMQAMDSAMRGRTTFVVAHRLSTLRRADLVVVLERGRIVQLGTHEQLMHAEGHYSEAASLQLADHDSKRRLGLTQGVSA